MVGVSAVMRVPSHTNRPIGLRFFLFVGHETSSADFTIANFYLLDLLCLVALEQGTQPIPFRTRPLSPASPMVLYTRVWESRTLPSFFSAREIYFSRALFLPFCHSLFLGCYSSSSLQHRFLFSRRSTCYRGQF